VKTLAAPIALLVALALVGCSTPTPASTPTAAPSPTPTETRSAEPTTEPEAVPAELAIGNRGVQLYDSDGAEIGAFAWADETTTALAVLEQAFGAAPAPTISPGDGTHFADYEVYTFPGGVTYFTAINLEKPRAEYHLPSTITIDGAGVINGITVRTTQGLQVGGTLAEVLAASPADSRPHSLGTLYLVDPVDAALIGNPEESTDTVGVIVNAAGTVVRISAPYESNPL